MQQDSMLISLSMGCVNSISKPSGTGHHFQHFKETFFIIRKPLQPFIRITSGSPAPVCFTYEQRAVACPGHSQYARLKSLLKVPCCALVFAIYFFHEYAHDLALALVANQ